MYSKIKSMGHPLHPMLVNFPIGLLVTAAIFDDAPYAIPGLPTNRVTAPAREGSVVSDETVAE